MAEGAEKTFTLKQGTSVAEGGLEVTDQASRAAEEDGERAQISLGGSHDTLQR